MKTPQCRKCRKSASPTPWFLLIGRDDYKEVFACHPCARKFKYTRSDADDEGCDYCGGSGGGYGARSCVQCGGTGL